MQNHMLSKDIYFVQGLYSLLGQGFVDRHYVIVDLDCFDINIVGLNYPEDKEVIGIASSDVAYYRALRAGIDMVLDKRSRLQDILDYFLCNRDSGSYRASNSLTPREKEVLNLISRGIDSNDIAKRLGLNRKTVYTFRRNLMQKLGCENRNQLQTMLSV